MIIIISLLRLLSYTGGKVYVAPVLFFLQKQHVTWRRAAEENRGISPRNKKREKDDKKMKKRKIKRWSKNEKEN